MKQLHLQASAFLVLLSLLIGCTSDSKQVQDFIPGVYVKYSEGDYSKAWDTLDITLYDNKANLYSIKRRTGFQRILDGKIQPTEYEQNRMMTVFDPSSGQLQDRKSGKLFTFSQENKTVLFVSSEYKKLE